MKSVNVIRLLNLIREHGPLSRADLARISGLSKPNVCAQVDALIGKGLVVERGPGKSGLQGGKKPMLVEFDRDSGHLLAVELRPSDLRVRSTDLEGTVKEQISVPIEPQLGPDHVLDRVELGLTRILDGQKVSSARFRLISMAVYGRVDATTGVVLDAGHLFNWHHVDVRGRLEKKFGVPVFVDNNVNMAALGEWHHGSAKGEESFVFVLHESGIGAAVVMNGKLYQGAHWAAGEIAHSILDPRHAMTDWGGRGFLECMVGADRLAARLGCPVEDVPLFFGEGHRGTAAAQEIVEEAVLHLGLAIIEVVATFDPALVVLQGELFTRTLGRIRRLVRRAIPWTTTSIALSSLGADAVLMGTVMAARSHAFERIALSLNEEA